MMVSVEVNNCSETLMKYKNDTTPIFIQNMTSIKCINKTFHCTDHYIHNRNDCCYSKLENNPLAIKASFIFFGHLNSPLMNSRQMRSLQILEHFTEDFGAIYNHDSLSDIVILVDDKVIRAHKSILMAHSPVMKRMLEQDFLESKTNTLTIKDTNYELFDCFLKALYSGQIEDQSFSIVKQLYILADKYNVQILQLQCAEILISQLSMGSLCEILKLAYDYNIHDNKLKDEAKQFAAIHFSELVRQSEWKEMLLSYPQIGCDVIAMVYPPIAPVSQDSSEMVKDS